MDAGNSDLKKGRAKKEVIIILLTHYIYLYIYLSGFPLILQKIHPESSNPGILSDIRPKNFLKKILKNT